jgi:hypothetical protein
VDDRVDSLERIRPEVAQVQEGRVHVAKDGTEGAVDEVTDVETLDSWPESASAGARMVPM